jgi:hypothetical protein
MSATTLKRDTLMAKNWELGIASILGYVVFPLYLHPLQGHQVGYSPLHILPVRHLIWHKAQGFIFLGKKGEIHATQALGAFKTKLICSRK